MRALPAACHGWQRLALDDAERESMLVGIDDQIAWHAYEPWLVYNIFFILYNIYIIYIFVEREREAERGRERSRDGEIDP